AIKLKLPVLRINMWNCHAYIRYIMIANIIYMKPNLVANKIVKVDIMDPNNHKNTKASVDFWVALEPRAKCLLKPSNSVTNPCGYILKLPAHCPSNKSTGKLKSLYALLKAIPSITLSFAFK